VAVVAALIGFMASPDAARPAQAAATAPQGFYGIAPTTALTAEDFQRLARANIRTVRIIFYWPQISTGNGTYNWLNVDGSVIHASAAGVRLIPTLLGSPRHAASNPLEPPLDSSQSRDQWQDFVRSAVERYGPGGDFWDFVDNCPPDLGHCRPDVPEVPIRVWQAWNEPNLSPFWHPAASPGEYAELLELTHEAVKDVDPGATLITGGIAAGGRGGPGSIPQNDFIAALYQRGAAADFDGLDLHPYQATPKKVVGAVQDARAVAHAYGDDATPTWITEVGWSTEGPKSEELVTTRKKQGKYLQKTMRMLTGLRDSLKIQLVSWFTYLDGQRICAWCHGSGLFDKKGKAKPAWRKYVSITGGQP
jgi:hypothetical protein